MRILVIADNLRIELKYEVSSSKIATAYRIGKRGGDDHQGSGKILVKFNRRDDKHDLNAACKTAKPKTFISTKV